MEQRIARLEGAIARAEAAAAQIASRYAHLRSETQSAINGLDALIAGTEGKNG
ncbi:MAG: hypothetical protein WCZ66_10980 [Sphingomonadaceae bacterium]